MYLLGVSGGMDSMFLLEQFKNKKIIVAHVNYNKRNSAQRDEIIVKRYCEQNNIPFFSMNFNEKLSGNFQDEARKIRYNFFKKIYKENYCTKLLLAHHKDDFIETVVMQQQSARTPFYFGIKDKITLFNMNIERPFINQYFKEDIENLISVKYGVDETNFSNDYQRNVVRKKISKWSIAKKEKFISEIVELNNKLEKEKVKVSKLFNKLSNSEFSLLTLRGIKEKRTRVMYYILNKMFDSPNISKSKIQSIWNFIDAPEGNKIFKVNDQSHILKKDGKLFFQNNI